MGVSRVDYGGETLVDLTGDTVNPSVLLQGETAHGADGETVEGEVKIITTGIVGEIKSYMGTTPPESFLACDGAVYNIADYPYLAQHFLINFGKTNFFGGDGVDTFAVPDLRGEFLRGTGTNGHSGEGSGSGVGSHQGSTIFPYYGGSANASYVVSQKTPSNFDVISRNSSYYFTSVNKSGDAVRQSFTARPTNTSVLYCIRYKPAFMADNEGMLELATEIEKVREKTATVKTLTATEEGAPLDATMGKVLDDKIEEIKGISSSNPIGTIISFMGIEAPNGYLICDGSQCSISDYPYLAQHFIENFGSVKYFGGDGISTFAVPDLRGEFLRGTGTGIRNTGSGSAVGTHQNATQHATLGGYSTSNDGWVGVLASTNSIFPSNNPYADLRGGSSNGVYFGNNKNTTSDYKNKPTWYTARPTNTSVLYCIKY